MSPSHRKKPLIFSANQWTGLYVIETFVTKELITINLVLRNNVQEN